MEANDSIAGPPITVITANKTKIYWNIFLLLIHKVLRYLTVAVCSKKGGGSVNGSPYFVDTVHKFEAFSRFSGIFSRSGLVSR